MFFRRRIPHLYGLFIVVYVTSCLPQLSMEKVQAMAEQVEIKAKVVQTEVKALVLRHKKALEERECELLWKVSGHSEDRLLSQLCGKASEKDPGREPKAVWSISIILFYFVLFFQQEGGGGVQQ